MKHFLNAGCGTHYATGWVNTDVWDDGNTTKPDIKVKSNEPYPFEDDHFDAVFLGHVLEHMPWPRVPEFLGDMKRISKNGSKFLVCGPDVLKTIVRWANGKEPWTMVLATMEHQDMNAQPGMEHLWWDGAHHHWNCHHERVWNLLENCGFVNLVDVSDVIPKNTRGTEWENDGMKWPVVGHWYWQFAILCENAK